MPTFMNEGIKQFIKNKYESERQKMKIKRKQIVIETVPARWSTDKDSRKSEIIPKSTILNLKRGDYITRDFWVNGNFIHADLGQIIGTANEGQGILVTWFIEDPYPYQRPEAIPIETLKVGIVPLTKRVACGAWQYWKVEKPEEYSTREMVEDLNFKLEADSLEE